MIYYNIIRKFCSIATIQLKTAAKAKLVKTMLAQNSESSLIFNRMTQIPEIKELDNIFTKSGYELRIAGGAVRDLLCGIQPNDLDFATNATPTQMIDIMRDKDNIRLITTPSGERHGTVTARINDKHQFEITTLRIDKTTDGRHAEVVFVNDWKIDASRRDLTINSMFLGLDGVLYDYFDGENDLKNKNIRFVGDPEARIKEDYLRIFRYFRFHARFGCTAKHDSQTLLTIKNNCEGLARISGERIWSEMKRILILRQCEDVLKVMFNEIEIGKYLGFKQNSNIVNANKETNVGYYRDLNEFHEVLSRFINAVDKGYIECWEPSTLFSSLIPQSGELLSVSARLKLSNLEKETILYIITNRTQFESFDLNALRTQLALTPKPNQNNMKRYIVECMKYKGLFTQLETITSWQIPEFPLKGNLIGPKIKKRNLISLVMNELKFIWAKSNFQMSEKDLMLEMDKILENEKYKQ